MREVIIGVAMLSALFSAESANVARAQTGVGPQPVTATGQVQRFRTALTYEQFTAGDTARRQEWTRHYEQAGVPVSEMTARVRKLPGRWHLLVVAESWCGDAVNSVPYLARLAGENPAIELRVLRKADARALLDTHLLDGRSATPVVIVYDSLFIERGVWIERPAALRALIASKEGRTCEDALREDVARWREADGGRSVLAEVVTLIERARTADLQAKRPTIEVIP